MKLDFGVRGWYNDWIWRCGNLIAKQNSWMAKVGGIQVTILSKRIVLSQASLKRV